MHAELAFHERTLFCSALLCLIVMTLYSALHLLYRAYPCFLLHVIRDSLRQQRSSVLLKYIIYQELLKCILINIASSLVSIFSG